MIYFSDNSKQYSREELAWAPKAKELFNGAEELSYWV